MQNVARVESTRKHLTNEEKERRENGEKAFLRDEEVLIQLPEYLNDDREGQRVWCQVLADAAAFGIFDNLDAETLGTYCSVTSRIISLRKKYRSCANGHRKTSDMLEISKELRLLEGEQLSYASKMGLTPESRIRLAQRVTVPEEDDTEDLYG
jgi:P27 family predicted phage terminase small subunit